MHLDTVIPGYYIPPKVYYYPPAADMAMLAKRPLISWDVGTTAALTTQPIFTAFLMGDAESPPLDDYELRMTSFHAYMNLMDYSYIQCQAVYADGIEQAVLDRRKGDLVISMGYELGGVRKVEEIARGTLSLVQVQRGGRHESLVMTGIWLMDTFEPRERVITKLISYRRLAIGKRSITT